VLLVLDNQVFAFVHYLVQLVVLLLQVVQLFLDLILENGVQDSYLHGHFADFLVGFPSLVAELRCDNFLDGVCHCVDVPFTVSDLLLHTFLLLMASITDFGSPSRPILGNSEAAEHALSRQFRLFFSIQSRCSSSW